MGQHNNNIMQVQLERDITRSYNRITRLRRSFLHSTKNPDNNIMMLPATKGAGSVNQGIQYLQEQQISITRRSINLLKEYSKYSWLTDRDGNPTQKPMDLYNHAMDAARYGVSDLYMNSEEEDDYYKEE